MLRKDLQGELERDKVSDEIIGVGFLAYDYLNNPQKCPGGAAYHWEIADAVLGVSTMGWSTAREKIQVVLSLFEDREVVEQRKSDKKYVILNRLG